MAWRLKLAIHGGLEVAFFSCACISSSTRGHIWLAGGRYIVSSIATTKIRSARQLKYDFYATTRGNGSSLEGAIHRRPRAALFYFAVLKKAFSEKQKLQNIMQGIVWIIYALINIQVWLWIWNQLRNDDAVQKRWHSKCGKRSVRHCLKGA